VSAKAARGAILTFPSRVAFSTDQIVALDNSGIRVLILYGTVENCLESFLRREQESGRGLSRDFWLHNNSDIHERLGDPSYERHRLQVFQAERRLDRAALIAAVKERAK
jgi:hypothetical protein